jgi:hypothetical protein
MSLASSIGAFVYGDQDLDAVLADRGPESSMINEGGRTML